MSGKSVKFPTKQYITLPIIAPPPLVPNMTYVFGGTLNLTQSIDQPTIPKNVATLPWDTVAL